MGHWLVDGGDHDQFLDRAHRYLDHVGLGERSASRAGELSGGERQRLNVARVLSSNCPVLLLDEPTNQLDRDNARHVMELLVDAATSDRRAIIVVTHDRESIPGGRVVELTPGGLVER